MYSKTTSLTALARSDLALRREGRGAAALEAPLTALLESDLVHAHHWRPVEGGFALQTTARLAGPTLRLEHVPALVTYRIVPVDGRGHLVRGQETPPEPPTAELAAIGASAAALVPGKDVRPNRFGWKALDTGCTVRVTLAGEAPGEVTVRLAGEGTQKR